MSNTFMRVNDVANELKVSTSYAYKVIKSLNKQLREKGYMTIAGRVSRKYFLEKMCYGTGIMKDQLSKVKRKSEKS